MMRFGDFLGKEFFGVLEAEQLSTQFLTLWSRNFSTCPQDFHPDQDQDFQQDVFHSDFARTTDFHAGPASFGFRSNYGFSRKSSNFFRDFPHFSQLVRTLFVINV